MADDSLPQQKERIFGIRVTGFYLRIVSDRNTFGDGAAIASLALTIFFTQSSKKLPKAVCFALGSGSRYLRLKKF
ncbi:hypothetical protein [Nostoc sp. C117]|uniref:hypothetical protein n=1 Tax=Nostoc sp. C117 TaxID=3349875 RepID=UPI00370D8B0F